MHTDLNIGAADESAELLAMRNATRYEQMKVEVLVKVGQRFDLTHYHGLLITMALFLNSWEPCIIQALPEEWRDWFVCRRRSVLLKRDLNALCLSFSEKDLQLQIDLGTPSAAWGSLFAMEIFILSSSKISAWLHQKHGVGTHNGGAYFAAGSHATSILWREFQKVIKGNLEGPEPQAEASAAATQTFRALAKEIRKMSTKQSAVNGEAISSQPTMYCESSNLCDA